MELGRTGNRWRKPEPEDTFCAPIELPTDEDVKEMSVNEKLVELPGSTPLAQEVAVD